MTETMHECLHRAHPRLVALGLLALCHLSNVGLSQAVPRVRPPAPPGRMIDVGGYRLHLSCTGRGSPTVVLIHGFGDFSIDWTLVQQSLGGTTRVCSYDRAGQAWSDRGPAPRGLRRITDELHALLEKSGETKPYVLVGHSWGGLIPRLYVPKYQREVAGVVFVDASHEDMWMWLNGVTLQPRLAPDSLWNRLWPRNRPSTGSAAPPTVTDTIDLAVDTTTPKLDPPFDRLPIDAQRLRRWAQSLPFAGLVGGDWNDVREDFREVRRAQGAKGRPFAAIPVFVLTAGKDDFENEKEASADVQRAQFARGQQMLADLSSNSRHVVASASGHRIQIDEPDLVVEIIRQVIESARSGRPLCCRHERGARGR